MSHQCPKCVGEGLIGSGEFPHLRQGAQQTCPDCHGTGRIADEADAAPEAQEEQSSGSAETPVDNQPNEKPKRGGIFGWLG